MDKIEELQKEFEGMAAAEHIIPRKGSYSAAEVDAWGLPKQNYNYDWLKPGDIKPGLILLSFSRCQQLKLKVMINEQPAAFRRVQKGYIALYDRTGLVDPGQVFEGEVYGGAYVYCNSCKMYVFYEIPFKKKIELLKNNQAAIFNCNCCNNQLTYIPARKLY